MNQKFRDTIDRNLKQQKNTMLVGKSVREVLLGKNREDHEKATRVKEDAAPFRNLVITRLTSIDSTLTNIYKLLKKREDGKGGGFDLSNLLGALKWALPAVAALLASQFPGLSAALRLAHSLPALLRSFGEVARVLRNSTVVRDAARTARNLVNAAHGGAAVRNATRAATAASAAAAAARNGSRITSMGGQVAHAATAAPLVNRFMNRAGTAAAVGGAASTAAHGAAAASQGGRLMRFAAGLKKPGRIGNTAGVVGIGARLYEGDNVGAALDTTALALAHSKNLKARLMGFGLDAVIIGRDIIRYKGRKDKEAELQAAIAKVGFTPQQARYILKTFADPRTVGNISDDAAAVTTATQLYNSAEDRDRKMIIAEMANEMTKGSLSGPQATPNEPSQEPATQSTSSKPLAAAVAAAGVGAYAMRQQKPPVQTNVAQRRVRNSARVRSPGATQALQNAARQRVAAAPATQAIRSGGGLRGALTQAAERVGLRGALKVGAKAVPLLGLGLGLYGGVTRAMDGDYRGAGLEVLSGLASLIPGFGTAAAVAIQGGLAIRDVANESQRVMGQSGEALNQNATKAQGAVAAASASAVTAATQTMNLNSRAVQNGAVTQLNQLQSSALANTKQMGEANKSLMTSTIEKINAVSKLIVDSVKSGAKWLWDLNVKAFDTLKGVFNSIVSTISSVISSLVSAAANAFKTGAGNLWDKLTGKDGAPAQAPAPSQPLTEDQALEQVKRERRAQVDAQVKGNQTSLRENKPVENKLAIAPSQIAGIVEKGAKFAAGRRSVVITAGASPDDVKNPARAAENLQRAIAGFRSNGYQTIEVLLPRNHKDLKGLRAAYLKVIEENKALPIDVSDSAWEGGDTPGSYGILRADAAQTVAKARPNSMFTGDASAVRMWHGAGFDPTQTSVRVAGLEVAKSGGDSNFANMVGNKIISPAAAKSPVVQQDYAHTIQNYLRNTGQLVPEGYHEKKRSDENKADAQRARELVQNSSQAATKASPASPGTTPSPVAPTQASNNSEAQSQGQGGLRSTESLKGTQLRRMQVYNAFLKVGFSQNQAIAMTGEVGRENSFSDNGLFGEHQDPASFTKGRGRIMNAGMISFNNERRARLEQYMASQGVPWNGKTFPRTQESIEAQARFIKLEMESPQERGNTKAFRENPNAKVEDLQYQVGKKYIRWAIDNPKFSASGLRNMAAHTAAVRRDLGITTPGGSVSAGAGSDLQQPNGGVASGTAPIGEAQQPSGVDPNSPQGFFDSMVSGIKSMLPGFSANISDVMSWIDKTTFTAAETKKPVYETDSGFRRTNARERVFKKFDPNIANGGQSGLAQLANRQIAERTQNQARAYLDANGNDIRSLADAQISGRTQNQPRAYIDENGNDIRDLADAQIDESGNSATRFEGTSWWRRIFGGDTASTDNSPSKSIFGGLSKVLSSVFGEGAFNRMRDAIGSLTSAVNKLPIVGDIFKKHTEGLMGVIKLGDAVSDKQAKLDATTDVKISAQGTGASTGFKQVAIAPSDTITKAVTTAVGSPIDPITKVASVLTGTPIDTITKVAGVNKSPSDTITKAVTAPFSTLTDSITKGTGKAVGATSGPIAKVVGTGKSLTETIKKSVGAVVSSPIDSITKGIGSGTAKATVDTITKAVESGKSPIDAITKVAGSGKSPIDSITKAVGANKSTVDAITKAVGANKSTVDAITKVSGGTKSPIDAITKVTGSAKSPIDAITKVTGGTKSPIDAITKVTGSAKSPIDAITKVSGGTKSPIDAITKVGGSGKSPIDSITKGASSPFGGKTERGTEKAITASPTASITSPKGDGALTSVQPENIGSVLGDGVGRLKKAETAPVIVNVAQPAPQQPNAGTKAPDSKIIDTPMSVHGQDSVIKELALQMLKASC